MPLIVISSVIRFLLIG